MLFPPPNGIVLALGLENDGLPKVGVAFDPKPPALPNVGAAIGVAAGVPDVDDDEPNGLATPVVLELPNKLAA